mmetsp:Transcript_15500/g.29599  ORF Transcript_15500/g.29599 Transcript_15500/m.29599 type:complete len:236 (-) Transcript_15500:578-1285(-)
MEPPGYSITNLTMDMLPDTTVTTHSKSTGSAARLADGKIYCTVTLGGAVVVVVVVVVVVLVVGLVIVVGGTSLSTHVLPVQEQTGDLLHGFLASAQVLDGAATVVVAVLSSPPAALQEPSQTQVVFLRHFLLSEMEVQVLAAAGGGTVVVVVEPVFPLLDDKHLPSRNVHPGARLHFLFALPAQTSTASANGGGGVVVADFSKHFLFDQPHPDFRHFRLLVITWQFVANGTTLPT